MILLFFHRSNLLIVFWYTGYRVQKTFHVSLGNDNPLLPIAPPNNYLSRWGLLDCVKLPSRQLQSMHPLPDHVQDEQKMLVDSYKSIHT